MSKPVTARSDVLEVEYDAAVTMLIKGAIVLVLGAIATWLFRLSGLYQLVILSAAALLAGIAICAWSGWRMHKAREVPFVSVDCPFCSSPMHFMSQPTDDYTCESCSRRVQYADGQMVPTRQVTCPVCSATHTVQEKTTHYQCDRCNRTLSLTDPSNPTALVAEQSEMLQNYDVILTQAGRQPNDVAMALQSILVTNLREARQQMEKLPLTVVRNVPQRKAEAIRARLRELGSTAVIRPTSDDSGKTGR